MDESNEIHTYDEPYEIHTYDTHVRKKEQVKECYWPDMQTIFNSTETV